MFEKFENFCVFTTKPKLDDLISDGKEWINRNRGLL